MDSLKDATGSAWVKFPVKQGRKQVRINPHLETTSSTLQPKTVIIMTSIQSEMEASKWLDFL